MPKLYDPYPGGCRPEKPKYKPTAQFAALLVQGDSVLRAYQDSGLSLAFNKLFAGPTFTVDEQDNTLYYTPSRAGAQARPAGGTLKGECLFFTGSKTLMYAITRQSKVQDSQHSVTFQVEQFDMKLAVRQKGVQVISFEETRPIPNPTEAVTACKMQSGFGVYSGLGGLKTLNEILSQKPLKTSPFGAVRKMYKV